MELSPVVHCFEQKGAAQAKLTFNTAGHSNEGWRNIDVRAGATLKKNFFRIENGFGSTEGISNLRELRYANMETEVLPVKSFEDPYLVSMTFENIRSMSVYSESIFGYKKVHVNHMWKNPRKFWFLLIFWDCRWILTFGSFPTFRKATIGDGSNFRKIMFYDAVWSCAKFSISCI